MHKEIFYFLSVKMWTRHEENQIWLPHLKNASGLEMGEYSFASNSFIRFGIFRKQLQNYLIHFFCKRPYRVYKKISPFPVSREEWKEETKEETFYLKINNKLSTMTIEVK